MVPNPSAGQPVSVAGVSAVRHRSATILCVLGALLLAFGTLAGIANRQVVDGAAFAAHADQIRQDDHVSRQVGIAMTNSIIRADADLTAVRPLIETAAISVVRSPSFSPVVRNAVQQVHDAFTKSGSGTVVLRLADVGAVLSGVVAQVAPQSSAALPSNLDVTLARIGDQSAARSTISATHRVTVLAWLLPLLALLAFAGAAWLLGWCKSALRPIGRAVIAAGGLIVVLAGLGSGFASAADADTLAGALRASLLDIVVGLLWWPAAVLIGTGAVLRVLAALEDDGAQDSDWRDWLAIRPVSQRTQALRAGGFVVVGGFVVFRPSVAAQVIAVVIGMGVLVIGLSEATRVILDLARRRRSERSGRDEPRYV